jgi:eukaryotic-like serine/threonine-protein kinase
MSATRTPPQAEIITGSTTTVGSVLNGSYLLERVIAEGGMGMVYEAQHLRLPRKFAVKVLGKPKDPNLVATALQRFRREAEIAAQLLHPHIVETFDFQVSEGGSPYLVMELLMGQDLSDRLKAHGRLHFVAAMRIIDEISFALDVAHDKGVVHRDLKPANIYLSQRGERDDFVKVLDFGVSKLIDAATLTQEKAMVGTPLYMSPEQAVGAQDLTAESDVFSLGAIAFEILTGRRAFAASSIPSILYQIVHGPTPTLSNRIPGIPRAVDAVFAKVLAKKKRDRFTRATEFTSALRMALFKPDSSSIENGSWQPIDIGTAADDRGSGVIRAGMTAEAGVTDIDSSTRAEELRDEVPSAPPTPLTGPSLSEPILRPRARTTLIVTALVGAAAIGGVVALLSQSSPRPLDAPAPPAPAPAPAPAPTPKPELTFAPDPIPPPLPAEIQYVFHVRPKQAQISIDDKTIRGSQITLPRQSGAHRIKVTAQGYNPIAFAAGGGQSRTFELHMERLPKPEPVRRSPKPPKKPDKPIHDAAPVQDL